MDLLYGWWKTITRWIFGSSSESAENQNQTETSESSNENDIPATNPPPTQISEESSPAQPTDLSPSGPQIQSYFGPDHTADVDRINLRIKCSGKTLEVDVYPLESISVLLKEACEWAKKKPEKMCLVFDGNCLDVNKAVSHYKLRGGSTVNLIGRA